MAHTSNTGCHQLNTRNVCLLSLPGGCKIQKNVSESGKRCAPTLRAGRFLSGLLNGNAGVVKTYIGETTDKTQQVKAFSVFALAFGIASCVAPGVGRVVTHSPRVSDLPPLVPDEERQQW
jgi:hypothetical protein